MCAFEIVCGGCGQKYGSPVLAQMDSCPECTFNKLFKDVVVKEFPDRLESFFPVCPETNESATVVFNFGSGMVLCRSWKKCKQRMNSECLEKHMEQRVKNNPEFKRIRSNKTR
jgi:hypothetical protein